ncbi:MAG: guanine deaminase [Aestuariivita sp.]|nr:guanine deaminase [Aestuariivita sp.]MCY4201880.1 guanine deaminase [Aestuariivita sp.]
MQNPKIIAGHVLSFRHSPFHGEPEAAVKIHEAVALAGTRIHAIGALADLQREFPAARVEHYQNCLITAGFVDSHVHYPQTAIIASWGKRLLDWLNSYTFPEEARFGDYSYAREIAERYFDLVLTNGTTTVCSFGTIHPESINAFFEAAQARNLRVAAGKTCMDRNAPHNLRDTAQTAYDESKKLLEAWHNLDRCCYVISPRFSPTSTSEQLLALGALWAEFPDCLMQTHLAEQHDEVAWVNKLFPECRDYLETYEAHGLLGPNGLYGHAIHLEARERDRLKEVGAALVHCPTSNTFIGSGLFPLSDLVQLGLRIGLATDTGGGSSFSMLRTMAAAYEIGQLQGVAIHPIQLLWLATIGSASAMRLEDKIGNIQEGFEADLVALDLASTGAIEQRSKRAENLWEAVFPTIMMGDDRAIAQVWIAGEHYS